MADDKKEEKVVADFGYLGSLEAGIQHSARQYGWTEEEIFHAEVTICRKDGTSYPLKPGEPRVPQDRISYIRIRSKDGKKVFTIEPPKA